MSQISVTQLAAIVTDAAQRHEASYRRQTEAVGDYSISHRDAVALAIADADLEITPAVVRLAEFLTMLGEGAEICEQIVTTDQQR